MSTLAILIQMAQRLADAGGRPRRLRVSLADYQTLIADLRARVIAAEGVNAFRLVLPTGPIDIVPHPDLPRGEVFLDDGGEP